MLKLRIALIALVILLVVIVPVYAQESTPEATGTTAGAAATLQAAPPETRPVAGVAEDTSQVPTSGATALVLLIGVVAIGAVAGGALIRATYQPPKE